jgi:hypothetical protein
LKGYFSNEVFEEVLNINNGINLNRIISYLNYIGFISDKTISIPTINIPISVFQNRQKVVNNNKNNKNNKNYKNNMNNNNNNNELS